MVHLHQRKTRVSFIIDCKIFMLLIIIGFKVGILPAKAIVLTELRNCRKSDWVPGNTHSDGNYVVRKPYPYRIFVS
ncbi:MAG: hypothetical protein CL600_04950 [Alteromonas sp.]|nr:hypothetical protein BM528_10920 [Alteromonas sp. RW2A1]AUC88643.1 hypothetical protein CW735_11020 [Alteromonas sp. MB-3u-76]MAI64214.1 hypothetical protein [Alteromonas sp.]